MSRSNRRRSRLFAWQALLVLALPFVLLATAQMVRWRSDGGEPRALKLLQPPVPVLQLHISTDPLWRLLQLDSGGCPRACLVSAALAHRWKSGLGRRSPQLRNLYLHSRPLSSEELAQLAQQAPSSRPLQVSAQLLAELAALADANSMLLMDPQGQVAAVIPAGQAEDLQGDSALALATAKDLRRLIR